MTFVASITIISENETNLSGIKPALTENEKYKVFYVGSSINKAQHVTVAYKVDLTQLINGIGGALGLFLGFSLLSILELCYQYVGAKWQ